MYFIEKLEKGAFVSVGTAEGFVTVQFADLPIISEIQSALRSLGYETPTPIQAGAIPPLLAGCDLLGCAQTGTGKTAAFAVPLLQRIHVAKKRPNPFEPIGLILAPTRELVVQISENLHAIGRNTRVKHACIYGGVGQRPQVAALTQGVHVLVATPGRLMDLVDQQYCNLGRIECFILDEADRMLDMGFMPEIQRIIRLLPREKQSVFLSATMPPPIKSLASALLHNHETVMVAPPATTADRVQQRVMFVDKSNKRKLLDHLLTDPQRARVLVFMRTKYGADRMYKSLIESGVSAEGIHGGRSQNARQRVLHAFRDGEVRVLIATDVAARGIDIDDITHVINYEVPHDPDSYVHRIGRTARAGAAGESITLCEGDEYAYFAEIEKRIGKKIDVDRDHPFHSVDAEDEELRDAKRQLERREGGGRTRAIHTRTPRASSASRGVRKEQSPAAKRASGKKPSVRQESGAVGKEQASVERKKFSTRATEGGRGSKVSVSAGGREARTEQPSRSDPEGRTGRRSKGETASKSNEEVGRRRTLSGKVRKIKPKTSTGYASPFSKPAGGRKSRSGSTLPGSRSRGPKARSQSRSR
ncbi:ATP-dependent RNA helicase RhlE [Pirellula sp. SH-Sr6A]|nr:ATP-dependent RNA helicase RhlE [Pirellula sp. SH-Sr6A]